MSWRDFWNKLILRGGAQAHERFTYRARNVMELAKQEAYRFNHEYIGTEHILLGLLREDSGVAANALKDLGVDLGIARIEVENIICFGPDLVTIGKLPRTPRARNAIAFAIEEAKALGDREVGTGHLLLGLIREKEGVAAQVLMNLGLKPELVRERVLNQKGSD